VTRNVESLPSPGSETGAEQSRLVPDDRLWMEGVFGCEWPSDENEALWLEEVNVLVDRGSTNLQHASAAQKIEYRSEVIAARHQFFELLPAIPAATFERDIGTSYAVLKAGLWPVPSTFIESQRLLSSEGVDGLKIITRNPRTLQVTAGHLTRWAGELREIGLDGMSMLKEWPVGWSVSAQTIRSHLYPMYAAARAAGIREYKEAAHEFVTTALPEPAFCLRL
jgi:hypothetical protein